MKIPVLVLVIFLFPLFTNGQQDLLKELEENNNEEIDFESSAFKGSRLVNGQSVESRHKNELEFIFAHRFEKMNDGLYELFGLDHAYVRIGLEYGITNRLSIGIGRNSVDKTIDNFFRYRILRQTKNSNKIPVSISAYGNWAIKTSPKKSDSDIQFNDRLSYTSQLLIARKITQGLSLQLMPTLVHKNLTLGREENSNQFALGVGGRMKISRSVSINSEYYYRFNVPDGNPYYNALGFGIDIETGGHVFQIVLTNTRGLTERAFITETLGDFFDGDIHLGFNVTRTFQFGTRKNRD
jgi:hypothetical protein